MNTEFDILYKRLSEFLPASSLVFNADMSKYTTLKVGGKAKILAFPTSVRELNLVISLCKKFGAKIYVVGKCSKIVVLDSGINGVVIKTDNMRTVTVRGNLITAESGASLISVVSAAQQNSLTGLEWACGIPGSVGGAIYMNAGAYKGQTADVIKSVKAFNEKLLTIKTENLGFGYRESIFNKPDYSDYVITSAVFKLKKGNLEDIKRLTEEYTLSRRKSQNVGFPSAGSAFKRPVTGYAAKYIEDAGLKGYKIGGAQISEVHSGFIVNTGTATSDDVVKLIDYVASTVYKKYNVKLTPEIKILGG